MIKSTITTISVLGLFVLGGCSETEQALIGGGAKINSPTLLAGMNNGNVYQITCDARRVTQCSIPATQVCPKGFNVLESKPRSGFVKGNPAQLLEVAFKCKI